MQQELFNRDFFKLDLDLTPIKFYFSRGKQERLQKISSVVDEEFDWISGNSDPKAVLTFLTSPSVIDEHWNQADMIAAAVVTLGEKPENRVSELFDNGKMERAFVLDTLASGLVHFCAIQVYQNIVTFAEKAQLTYTGRITPGGADLDFSYQKKLLDFVDIASIGVFVTSGLMMKPVKSSSFLTLLGKNINSNLGCNHCRNCDKIKKCEYGKFGIFIQ
ncbi:MAG: hypothetical protein ACFFCZ_27360 [Promethearchaeota archaeon]